MLQKGTNVLVEHKKKNLVLEAKLERIDFLDNRVYKRAEDKFYPSVTTILQYMPKNKYFETWIKDVGHNADIILRRAGEEGTQTHNAIEQLLLGEEIGWLDDYGNAKYSLIVWEMVNRFKLFWQAANPELIYTEEFTYSDEHEYAGTADLVVKINGEMWLLDIKTSNSLHKAYDLQLAAYAKALEERKGIKIDKIGILWLKSSKRTISKKAGEYYGKGWELRQITDIESNFEIFKLIHRLYRIENPVIEPVYKSYPLKLKL